MNQSFLKTLRLKFLKFLLNKSCRQRFLSEGVLPNNASKNILRRCRSKGSAQR
jgi:hypothetical protein